MITNKYLRFKSRNPTALLREKTYSNGKRIFKILSRERETLSLPRIKNSLFQAVFILPFQRLPRPDLAMAASSKAHFCLFTDFISLSRKSVFTL